ncbi:beta-galactosidase [Cellulomonas cellasea]|uniref:Beta-galactosidase n=1 Tax=Cellulomonas cellasea TaxID=43670 RepID=A0A7W4UIB2_9CELL|nr:beta-galactosidase [Cellulomonas cellasea]MBB2924673.1 beta-galactosidase [Cellulomonas cellasea]
MRPGHDRTPVHAPGWLPGVGAVSYGGDYNPEQWPEEVWAEDVALMRDAGVNLVSIGIFSWGLLEPSEGVYDFGWLDRVIELLHANGIRVDLGTPTASPPAWFFDAYPHTRVVSRDGTVLGFGSRGLVCPSSAEYRRAATAIATQLARRYGRHPALALWHVHNEYGVPVSEDYSATSAAAFRTWLQERYGSLDALNAVWGTAFWGQVYRSWDHVGVPALAPSVVNPAHRLDFARFTDDALLACFVAERDAIRAESPGIPITTNFMAGACHSTDLWRWAAEVDVVSNDHYLTAADPRGHVGLAMAADLTRSFAGGKPWILMEHSTSGVNWQERNVAKRPGEMARNALSHLGRGADAILFFQWRASRSGAEKFHSAMLPHAGTGSRVFREVRELGAGLAGLDEVLGSRVEADVAILWDQQSFWAQDLEWRPSVDARHRERVDAFYDRLWRDGITVDFAHPEHDLSRYKLVLAPASYLLTARAAENLTAYVAQGGTLLTSFFSGIVDEHDRVHTGPHLSVLRDALGVTVEEFLPLRAGERVHVALAPETGAEVPDEGHEGTQPPAPVVADVWADDLTLAGAEVVGTYTDGPAAGRPAITRHRHGAGTGWYLSTRPDADGLARVLRRVYRDAGVTPAGLPEDVEVVRRRGAEADFVVVANHTDKPVDLGLSGVDLLTGETAEPGRGALTVAGGGVRVVRTPRA